MNIAQGSQAGDPTKALGPSRRIPGHRLESKPKDRNMRHGWGFRLVCLLVALAAGVPVLAARNPGSWKVVTRLRGSVQSLAPESDQWLCIYDRLCLPDGHRVRTLAKSYARVDTMDYRYVLMGPFTSLRLEDLPVTASQVRMARFYKNAGEVIEKTKAFWRGESSFEVKTTRVILGTRGTGFSIFTAQRIAFVDGNGLWLMNDNGSGRTNLLAAPPGGRIGRFAFAPDGSRIVYEVWQPESGDPETIDLWTARSDGTS
ncbi:MAG: hypothetical protein V2A34_06225, partial [Lentisphaerota bacterium]